MAAAAIALAACSSPAVLQKVVADTDLPAAVELTDTPFFAQTEYQCGPAALATLLGAAGAQVAPDALVNEIYLPGRRGSLQPEMVAALRERGFLPYVLRPSLAALLAELGAGRPVLVLQRLGIGPWPAWHYAVVAGYDAGRGELVLRSGTKARRIMSVQQFLVTWERAGRWAMIALPPGAMPAVPDFTHYMEAVAGLEAMGRWQDEARKGYAAASRTWPAESLPWLGLANIAAAEADWPAAERGFRAALARDPQNVAGYNNRAEVLRQLGCITAATAAIAQAQRLVSPGHPLQMTVQATAAEIAADGSTGGTEPPACLEIAAAASPQVP